MSGNVENLIPERLRRIDDRLSNIEGDVQDLKLRTTVIEGHIGNFVLGISGVNTPIDRGNERVACIERRLDLSEQY